MDSQDIVVKKVEILPDGRIDTKNAALYVGVSEKTLATWRVTGAGPCFVKRGRVFYYKDDLDKWMREGRVASTAQAARLGRNKSE